jgi:hypothetical protein
LGSTIWRVFVTGVPEAFIMGPVGLLALATSGVFATGAARPDLAVAAIMASLFLSSSYEIVRTAAKERSRLRDR